MSETTESKYADLLRGLGFEKRVEPAKGFSIQCRLIETEDADVPPAAPVHVPPPEYPCFITVGGILRATFAWDETQQMWILKDKELDMSTYGFSLALQQFPLQ